MDGGSFLVKMDGGLYLRCVVLGRCGGGEAQLSRQQCGEAENN